MDSLDDLTKKVFDKKRAREKEPKTTEQTKEYKRRLDLMNLRIATVNARRIEDQRDSYGHARFSTYSG